MAADRRDSNGFATSERQLSPSVVQLAITGEIDLAVSEHLRQQINSAAAAANLVVLDLSRCEFIDSIGIGVLLQSRRELAAAGTRLTLCAPQGQVLRILTVTGLTGNGLVFAELDEALTTSAP